MILRVDGGSFNLNDAARFLENLRSPKRLPIAR